MKLRRALTASIALLGAACGVSAPPSVEVPRSTPEAVAAPTPNATPEAVATPTPAPSTSAPPSAEPPAPPSAEPPAPAPAAARSDVDGDGVYDLVLAPYEELQVWPQLGAGVLYYGGRTGLAAAATTLLPPARPRGGFVMLFSSTTRPRRLRPSRTLVDPAHEREDSGAPSFGHRAEAGDFDADGFTDIAVSTLDDLVHVYMGSAQGLPAVPSATLRATDGERPYDSAIRVGDFDADGFSDVLVRRAPAVAIVRGGPEGLVGPAVALTSPLPAELSTFAFALARATDPTLGVMVRDQRPDVLLRGATLADVDGDGRRDLVASVTRDDESGGHPHASLRVYLATADGFGPAVEQPVPNRPGCLAYSALVPARVGDVDGDGFEDVYFVEDLADGAVECLEES